ncbi:MAG: TonB-dependent receptor [Sulfurimonas sp.]
MKKKILVSSLAAASLLFGDSFELGQVNVQDNIIQDVNLFEKTLSDKQIQQTNAQTVDQALNDVSGISSNVMGARAESTIQMRGFNSNRIGVFIDGIPVYVPYDGNFDYGRFLTSDISQIDISKGYSSVVYGTNTMGGVINIVSKKPTKETEGNVRTEFIFDSKDKLSRHVESFNIGSRQGNYYIQLGGSVSHQDHYRLSEDYQSTPSQPVGDRLRSKTYDRKVSIKAGYIADDHSEVAITYANQHGVKQSPPATDTDIFGNVRYWDWPLWDKETISVAGQKNFDNSYIKALAYYDTFTNSLFSYDNDTYTTMNFGYAFKSRYEDYSYGTRLEYGVGMGNHFIKAAFNYKKDVHRGYDLDKTTEVKTLAENYADHTISLGLEDTWELSSDLELLGGVSFDQRSGDKIYDTNTAYATMLKKKTDSSVDPQIALVYSPDKTSKLRASVSRKTYLPTMKDRYSRRFNRFVPNPDLKNESSTHIELGYQKAISHLVVGVNAYYTKVKDAIQSVTWTPDPSLQQNQNVGTFDHKGGELDISYKYDGWDIGGNYSYINVKNTKNSTVKRTFVPKNQLFAYIQRDIGSTFSIYVNSRYREGAYQQRRSDDAYIKVPSFSTFDAKVIYTPIKSLKAEVGIKNITDRNVRYDMAFPMAGREYFAALNYKF